MDQQRNILFGKLSILRGFLSREHAAECFQVVTQAISRGQGTNLWETSVSRSFMPMEQAQMILKIIDQGQFVCRPGCPKRVPLSQFPAEKPFVCDLCQSPLRIVPIEQGMPPPNIPSDTDPSLPIPASHAPPKPQPIGSPPALKTPTPIRTTTSATDLVRNEQFGPFRIVKAIGRGGMGMVYQATKEGEEKSYAVKLLLERAAENKQTIERFTREIQVASRLHHDYIVGVVEAGFNMGLYWLAMEYVDGRDLATWRNEPGRSIGQGIQLIMKICEGMAYAHSRFIVHRDIKPGNIMVSRDGDQPKICDFGLAKALVECSELTKTGDILGTPLYMAPEQAMGNHLLVGPPTDVWAIGVMLYEMATGHLPFQGRTTFQILNAVATKPVKKPTEWVPTIPPPFEEIITKCMEKDPARRYRSAGDLKTALNALFS
jgi:serine/threonine protein kinase